ncbi:hypothetical protein [Flavobacterium sp.]|jgi:hypothetical protein|uniref:hypothetical protein n=1 Tax=Flavobacterium sp. TaxID=239 RepID=UPI0038FC34FE
MKKSNKLKLGSTVIIALFANLVFFTSCDKDNNASSENSEKQETVLKNTDNLNFKSTDGNVAKIASCPETLTNDGCNFTSGYGTDLNSQFTMVNLLNSCRTESLPAGCSWSSYTETRFIDIDYSNCCYTANELNVKTDACKQLAINARPSSGYLITNYQRINGFMVTTYGPYRMRVAVTYRAKSCRMIPIDGTQMN